jgi:hypothetical protein
MAHNLVEFEQHYVGVASATSQYLYLPPTPHEKPALVDGGLYCRVTFSAAVSGTGNLGMAEYFFAWHYATAYLLSTETLDRTWSLVTEIGAAILTSCVGRVNAEGVPYIRWIPNQDLWNWTVRGELWNESAD